MLKCADGGHELTMQNQAPVASTLDRSVANQLIGTVIAGRYKVVSLLGLGSAGAVYLVHHVVIRKRMAAKVLHPSLLGVPEVVARFEREAMTAAHIEHPNVAMAYDYGHTGDGGFFLILEYVEGQELSSLIAQGPLSVPRTLHIARQITSALCLTHELKIMHRDLKPENIMLTRQDGQPDFVKILDFGLAKVPLELTMQTGAVTKPAAQPVQLTKMGVLYGTPGYMAPEQVLSEAVDSRSDQYSLGVILYEMLTGRSPFDGNTVLELLDNHLALPLPPMQQRAPGVAVPEAVENIVRRLLAKRPEERFRDPQELLAALDGLPGAQPPPSSPPAEPVAANSQTAAPALASPPKVMRKGTVVALPLPSGSFGSQLKQLHKSLPFPLSKIPLLLLFVLGLLLVVLTHLPWLLKK